MKYWVNNNNKTTESQCKKKKWVEKRCFLQLNINILAWKIYTGFRNIIFITYEDFKRLEQ